MAAPGQRKVLFLVAPGFAKRYKAFAKAHPEVKDNHHVFNTNKRQIPPAALPLHMKDHVLKGRLAGIRECHLANDVLLLYTHEHDRVSLLDVCTHQELKKAGDRAARKARRH